MNRLIIIATVLIGCGDNIVEPSPDADDSLPTCASLGCAGLSASDKQCVATHVCACYVERNKPPILCSIE